MPTKHRSAPRRRRSYGVARRTYRRARGILGGSSGFGAIIQGAAAGIASQVGQKFLPGYGGPLGVGAVGWFTKNPTLMTLTGMQLSAMLPVGSLLGGSSTSTSSSTGGFI